MDCTENDPKIKHTGACNSIPALFIFLSTLQFVYYNHYRVTKRFSLNENIFKFHSFDERKMLCQISYKEFHLLTFSNDRANT